MEFQIEKTKFYESRISADIENRVIKELEKLFKFYKISKLEVPFQIVYKSTSYSLATMSCRGSWDENEGKFHFTRIRMNINYNSINKSPRIVLEEVIDHEFMHFLQYYVRGYTPAKYHDRFFYELGNLYNPKFEEIERKFHHQDLKDEPIKRKERAWDYYKHEIAIECMYAIRNTQKLEKDFWIRLKSLGISSISWDSEYGKELDEIRKNPIKIQQKWRNAFNKLKDNEYQFYDYAKLIEQKVQLYEGMQYPTIIFEPRIENQYDFIEDIYERIDEMSRLEYELDSSKSLKNDIKIREEYISQLRELILILNSKKRGFYALNGKDRKALKRNAEINRNKKSKKTSTKNNKKNR